MRRILIDECINPRLAPRIRASLPECSVVSVRDIGLAGEKDHRLIRAIDGRYDILLTLDKGFEFEHDLKRLSFGIIVLTAANNQMPSYERMLGELVQQIRAVSPGQVSHVMDRER